MLMGPAKDQRVRPDRRGWLAAAALAGITFAAFAPSLRCDFINFDDPFYVRNNPQVQGGLSREDIGWAFTTYRMGNWHPLTWLSLQLDASLWGTGPFGFHLTNVLLHAANTAVLLLALRSLTGAFWRSAAAALLFAVHPLRVESVTWVAERKDVLSALFGFVALWAYAAYARAPSVPRYVLVAGALALSLMAKPMLATLPCLLLVLDWWPLGRARAVGEWWRLAAEKVPLFAVVAAVSAVTVQAQAGQGAVMSLETYPPVVRAGNAAVSYVTYLVKTVWPTDLAPFYPHPGASLPHVKVAGAALLLAALTVAAVALRLRAPYLLAGWLWYLGTLVPVIGLVQVGDQAYADRYTYFPQVGLVLATCWGAADLAGTRTRAALAAAAAVAAVLAALTWDQEQVWRDSASVWEHSLRAADRNSLALMNLGVAREEQGRGEEAAECLREALNMNPGAFLARTNLGRLLSAQGKLKEAETELREACELAPEFAAAHSHLGEVLLRQRRFDEAVAEHERAIELDRNLSAAHCNLGLAETARGNTARAEKCFREALRLQPDLGEAHTGLGGLLLNQPGRKAEAIAELREGVHCKPRSAEAHLYLATALKNEPDPEEAAEHYRKATRIDPGLRDAWYGLGLSRLRQGRFPEAAEALDRAGQPELARQARARMLLPGASAPGAAPPRR
jgi:tetratricopeptide (TPR) repeat protein